eukprot:CAMPEP_0202980100 /NCGR_PEP_ID=MMETSP1396-20130829/86092_1 /ASSEMBLY_ACC=CAM_ASM_000872 /TAXON_ID= /ORGANISM="Pseudokeronopsis sp., Strain Brazil" /LENGTH=85 /DNA_ID=CAMNT_0049719867 /DNA_START=676 /DNA_END=934 /DNA_ORIENTATION=-
MKKTYLSGCGAARVQSDSTSYHSAVGLAEVKARPEGRVIVYVPVLKNVDEEPWSVKYMVAAVLMTDGFVSMEKSVIWASTILSPS